MEYITEENIDAKLQAAYNRLSRAGQILVDLTIDQMHGGRHDIAHGLLHQVLGNDLGAPEEVHEKILDENLEHRLKRIAPRDEYYRWAVVACDLHARGQADALQVLTGLIERRVAN